MQKCVHSSLVQTAAKCIFAITGGMLFSILIESNQSGRVKNLHSFVCTQHCSLTACIEKKEGMEGVARNIVFLYFVIKENAEVM